MLSSKSFSNENSMCGDEVYICEGLSGNDTRTILAMFGPMTKLVYLANKFGHCEECQKFCEAGVFEGVNDTFTRLYGSRCTMCCECLFECPVGAVVEAELVCGIIEYT
ncbi:hypothetical protein EP073_08100 [Geovibrio thiophilus]|uniref:4Fe-4S ferredoxin-type domain-containing protein n=1 Tax=Geovibrio thiophilus TaxID=139438 RepID=A0A3R5V1I3_9BACT|nr:hypothetical protein [Geovibrio thiophilus]QAR33363.1 hypothetical protein EP073_08100 [Geovibrio thiophilus]